MNEMPSADILLARAVNILFANLELPVQLAVGNFK
jgi:hypothetical protein